MFGAEGWQVGCGEGGYAEVLFEGEAQGVVAAEAHQHVLILWSEAEVSTYLMREGQRRSVILDGETYG